MAASFKTLARIQARVERGIDELEDSDALSVLEAVKTRVASGDRRKAEAEEQD